MANQYVNKVELADGTMLIDISSDTVSANKLLSGETAHDASGASVTGTIETKEQSALTLTTGTFNAIVSAPAGYYPYGGTLNIGYGAWSGQTSSINPVTAIAWVDKGYLKDDLTISVPTNLSTYAGTTITPTRSEQTAAPKYKWLTGDVKVAAIPNNYKTLEEIYPVNSLWATLDGTEHPAAVLRFGAWKRISPVKPTWNQLKQTTTWADMQIDSPTVFVWQRTS